MIVCSTRLRTPVRNSLLAMALLAILTPFNLVHAQKPGGEDPRVAKYQTIEREIKAAVNDGRLTAAEGKKKLAATRAMIFGKAKATDARTRKERAAERESNAALNDGRLTAAEGKKKLAATRAMIFGKAKVKAKAKVKPNGEGSGAKKYRAMERDIRAAVDAGIDPVP